jgi:Clp amino terminal domain, pathogenicity island component
LTACIDAERPWLKRTLDEGVVHDADREQWLAPPAPGRAQLAKYTHNVRLRDTQFHVPRSGFLDPVKDQAGELGHDCVSPQHLLLGLLSRDTGAGYQVLHGAGLENGSSA